MNTKRRGIYKKCPICKKTFYVKPYRINIIKCCSSKCGGKYRWTIFKHPWIGKKHSEETKEKMKQNHANFQRENHPNWKGGISPYIFVYIPNHPFKDKSGKIKRSRFVMERHLGRYLKPEEVVHHINRDTLDDRIENLKLFNNQSAHISFHNKYSPIANK